MDFFLARIAFESLSATGVLRPPILRPCDDTSSTIIPLAVALATVTFLCFFLFFFRSENWGLRGFFPSYFLLSGAFFNCIVY